MDNSVLWDETRDRVNAKLEQWRSILECRRFRLSRSKIKYMECNFSIRRGEDIVILDV